MGRSAYHDACRQASHDAEYGCDIPGRKTPGRLYREHVDGIEAKMKEKGRCKTCVYFGISPAVSAGMAKWGKDYSPTEEDYYCTMKGWDVEYKCPGWKEESK